MHIKLLVNKMIPDENGVPQMRRRGDWVSIKNKKTALAWMSVGEAEVYDTDLLSLLPDGSGLLLLGKLTEAMHPHVLERFKNLKITTADAPALIYPKSAIWDIKTPVRVDLLAVGLNLLSVWQVVVPLMPYNVLAMHMGDEEDRQRTQEVIHDLRVPVYDTSLMFVRRSADTKNLIDLWNEESQHGDPHLAFLRAVYVVKPTILATPVTWLRKADNG